MQRTARTPARRQNGPRPGTHLGTSAATATESEYCSRFPIFFGAAALCIPALIALSRIRADEIDYARARNAGRGEQAKSYHRVFDLGKTRNLYIFSACVFLFQFADASLLPVVGQNLAQSKTEYASILMAGLIVVPQIVVALLSPWVGYYSEKWGRKPLLLLGFGLLRRVLPRWTRRTWRRSVQDRHGATD